MIDRGYTRAKGGGPTTRERAASHERRPATQEANLIRAAGVSPLDPGPRFLSTLTGESIRTRSDLSSRTRRQRSGLSSPVAATTLQVGGAADEGGSNGDRDSGPQGLPVPIYTCKAFRVALGRS